MKNYTLKTKLIISYMALSLISFLAFLFISNFLLEKKFADYIMEKQEQKNETFVKAALDAVLSNADIYSFYNLGEKALAEGLILMINDKSGNEIFCMSCFDNMKCENMLEGMKKAMEKRFPYFAERKGQYSEKKYPLLKAGKNYGTVTLGFYGPFYYNDADIKFISILNKILIACSFIFLLLAFILGFIMASEISKPIEAVTLKTSMIETGNFSDRIDFLSGIKEIDILIGSVNNLAQTLEAEQKIKKEMAAEYAHEFRTPLAAIRLNLEGILDKIFKPDDARIRVILDEILRLSKIVSKIDRIIEHKIEKI